MEVEKKRKQTEMPIEDDNVPLPGFRFHPTDEELVGFYLQRKVDKKPLKPELIKQADIYKFDPWDLPKLSIGIGEKEWYFFCQRGRKYKNSVRPNRVTGSGFWKATGIDKPIYSSSGIIGLKKSLVYYRGTAGKGTKTEWMMHEFRQPSLSQEKSIDQEAEVWTLCRILKKNITHTKCFTTWKCTNSETGNDEVDLIKGITPPLSMSIRDQVVIGFGNEPICDSGAMCSNDVCDDVSNYADWEDLRSIVNYATLTFR